MDIRQDEAQQKFIGCEETDCGHIKYRETGDTLTVLSTFVPPELRGGGRAAKITRHVLDYARDKSLKVEPVCSYTQTFMQRHEKQYGDLRA